MMDIYHSIEEHFTILPEAKLWPDVTAVFSRAVRSKPEHWLLPGLACQACGGAIEEATPAMTALACLHISIKLIDDMIDDDTVGEYTRIGAPAAANLASVFQSLSAEFIDRSKFDFSTRQSIHQCLNKMILRTAIGQYLDSKKVMEEEAYWQVIRLKSGPFFGAALQIGALSGGSSSEIAAGFYDLGCLYGEAIQIHDDLNDALIVPASVDWVQMQPTMPIIFAHTVDHPDRERFIRLYPQITDPDILTEAQTILIRCGAVSYCFDRILKYFQEAEQTIKDLPVPNKAILTNLFRDLIQPIQELISEVGRGHSVSLSDISKPKEC